MPAYLLDPIGLIPYGRDADDVHVVYGDFDVRGFDARGYGDFDARDCGDGDGDGARE